MTDEPCFNCDDKPDPVDYTGTPPLCEACRTGGDGQGTVSEEDQTTIDLGTDDPSIDVNDTRSYCYPETMAETPQWLSWKMEGEDRKVPRAPWRYTDWPDRFASNKDPENWTDFETAREYCAKLPGHKLAYYLSGAEYSEVYEDFDVTEDDLPDAPRVGLIDFDKVRDPDTGDVHPAVPGMLEELGTYSDISTSGTGIHALGSFTLPDGVKALVLDISTDEWPKAEVEVYPGRRYTTMTGEAIRDLPDDVQDIQPTIESWMDTFDVDREHAHQPENEAPNDGPPGFEPTPDLTKEEVQDIGTTTDMDDVFDALAHVTLGDIRLRSECTEDGGYNDRKSFDPSWEQSDSGARLGHEGGFIYRKGNVGLSPLQVVALEERIIHSVHDYPSGDDFFDAVEALRQRGAHIPKYEPPTQRPQTNLFPAKLLERTSDEAAREMLQRRGLDKMAVSDVRDGLADEIDAAMQNGETAAVRSPTGSGKTYTSATTPWSGRHDVTGNQPVVLLEGTRKARDEAYEMAEEAGVEAKRLLGRSEACPVAAGQYDYENAGEADGITIEGMDPTEWFRVMCENRNIPFSVAHSHADGLVPNGLPCKHTDGGCRAMNQYDDIPRTDAGNPTHDVIIATHNFAYVPGLRLSSNIIIDEEPDYVMDTSHERMRQAIDAYLRWADGPYKSFTDLVTETPTEKPDDMEFAEYASRHGLVANEMRDSLAEQQEEAMYKQPDREWYFSTAGAHTMAPAVARAIFNAEESGAGRLRGKTKYHPPRFDAPDGDGQSANAVWVTVVLDHDYNIKRIRNSPDFSVCRSVVGLDAHVAGNDPTWLANVSPMLSVRRVLDSEEEALYRRFVRDLEVVQVGDAVNPLTSRIWWDEEGSIASRTEMICERIGSVHGDAFRTAITSQAVEDDLRAMVAEHGGDDAETMHYGATKSRNDFSGEPVGLVAGAIDPGDSAVLDLVAELGLDAYPETNDEPCSACNGSDDGCPDCEFTGYERASGRGFTGPDAESAEAALAAVRENEVAQAVGRYARDADDPDDGATVYVMTDAVPDEMVDIYAPGVSWQFTENQKEIIEYVAERDRPVTAPEVADSVSVTRQTVWRTLQKAVDEGLVSMNERAGPHGAHLYDGYGGGCGDGVVEVNAAAALSLQEAYEGTYTFHVTTRAGSHLTGADTTGAAADEAAETGGEGDGPPPTDEPIGG